MQKSDEPQEETKTFSILTQSSVSVRASPRWSPA